MKGRCSAHVDRDAPFRCASCARALCDECAAYVAHEEPYCAPCVAAIRRTSPLLRPVFAAGLFVAGAVPLAALVPPGAPGRTPALLAYALLAAATTFLSYREARRLVVDFDPAPRARDARVHAAPHGATYRSLPRRVGGSVRALTPPVSGAWATLLALAALAFPALVVPSLADLPRWLEAQAVVGIWWVLATLGLGHVLFHGTVAADDADRLEDPAPERGLDTVHLELPRMRADYGDGCAVGLAFLVVIGALFVLALLLAELVFPALFLAAYGVLATMTRAATRDRHDCRGRFGRALLWGGLWATLYTAPLAIVVALVHLALAG